MTVILDRTTATGAPTGRAPSFSGSVSDATATAGPFDATMAEVLGASRPADAQRPALLFAGSAAVDPLAALPATDALTFVVPPGALTDLSTPVPVPEASADAPIEPAAVDGPVQSAEADETGGTVPPAGPATHGALRADAPVFSGLAPLLPPAASANEPWGVQFGNTSASISARSATVGATAGTLPTALVMIGSSASVASVRLLGSSDATGSTPAETAHRQQLQTPVAASGFMRAESTTPAPSIEMPPNPPQANPAQPGQFGAAPLVVAPAVAGQTTVATPTTHATVPHSVPFATQVASPVFTLSAAGPGEHVLTVNVSPDNLGPVTVRAHVSGDGIRVELFAPNEAGREALRGILPELRRDLAGSGMSASLDLSEGNQAPDDEDLGPERDGENAQGQDQHDTADRSETAPGALERPGQLPRDTASTLDVTV